MRTRLLFITTIPLICLSAMANSPDDKAPIALKVTAGEVLKYQAETSLHFAGTLSKVRNTGSYRTSDVNSDGSFVTTIKVESVEVDAGSGWVKQNTGNDVTEMTFDKTGKLTRLRSNESDSVLQPAVRFIKEALEAPLNSPGAVAEGASWEVVYDNPSREDSPIRVQCTYVGTEKKQGKSCWKVKQVADAKLNTTLQTTMHGELTSWIDTESGRVVRKEYSLTNVPTNQGTLELVTEIVTPK